MSEDFEGWRKSLRSNAGGNCVEVGRSHRGTVGIRDTKAEGHGAILEFSTAEWAAFRRRITSG
jgi:hypothetical protein